MEKNSYKCAYCERKIKAGADVYGLGVKLKKGLAYPGGVGRMTRVDLPVGGRTLQCVVTADNSQARMEGWDLIFMTCSEKCGRELKTILEEEEELFEEIM